MHALPDELVYEWAEHVIRVLRMSEARQLRILRASLQQDRTRPLYIHTS